MNMIYGASFLRGVGIVFHTSRGRCETQFVVNLINCASFFRGVGMVFHTFWYCTELRFTMNMLCGASFLRGVGIVFHDNCGRCESRCALGTIHGYRFRGVGIVLHMF